VKIRRAVSEISRGQTDTHTQTEFNRHTHHHTGDGETITSDSNNANPNHNNIYPNYNPITLNHKPNGGTDPGVKRPVSTISEQRRLAIIGFSSTNERERGCSCAAGSRVCQPASQPAGNHVFCGVAGRHSSAARIRAFEEVHTRCDCAADAGAPDY